MRQLPFVAVFLFASIAQAAEPSQWSIMSQERRVWATATAGFDGQQTTQTEEFFGDFGLLDRDAGAAGTMTDPSGGREIQSSGWAYQKSLFTTRTIAMEAIASGTTFIEGSGASAETDAWARMTVQFDVAGDSHFRLNGYLDGTGEGQCKFQLAGPPAFSPIDVTLQLSYHEFVDQVIAAPAGSYTLYVDAFADTQLFGAGYNLQYAKLDIELDLLACGSSAEPFVLPDVAYALTENASRLFRNIALDIQQNWSRVSDTTYADGNGLASDPTTGKLYLLSTSHLFPGPQQHLYAVNGANGTSVEGSYHDITILSSFQDTDLLDIACRGDGVMFGVWGFQSTGMLGIVDPATGNVTLVGNFGAYDQTHGAALAFDPTSGLLYNAAGSDLYVIDLVAETRTPVALNGAPIIQALAFHPTMGTLYAGLDNGVTAVIDPTTGQVTNLADIATLPHDFRGLTFVTELVLDGDLDECLTALGGYGDTDTDGDIDLADHLGLLACLTGPGGGLPTADCILADVDEDGDVDLLDFHKIQRLSPDF